MVTQAGASWTGMTEIKLPAGGFCEAGGSYRDRVGRTRPMVLARSVGGRWSAAAKLPLPADASATSSSFSSVLGIACTRTATCVAVGSYENSAGPRALGLNQSKGKWTATGIASPAGAPPGLLSSVSCPAPGNCLAVGSFQVKVTHLYEPMSVLVRNGGFGSATPVTVVPAGAGTAPEGGLNGVSCVASGLCFATGSSRNRTGHYPVAVAMTWTGTVWSAAFVRQPAAAAKGASEGSELDAVSCTGNGRRTAVGYYLIESMTTGLTGNAEATSTG